MIHKINNNKFVSMATMSIVNNIYHTFKLAQVLLIPLTHFS